MKTIHLVKFHDHDHETPSEAWCTEDVTFGSNAFLTPALATCIPCLEAAAAYYSQVQQRLAGVRLAKMHGVDLP